MSKVLRNKEKYINKEDRSKSPNKKAKGKLPDIERALSNWVRNAQKTGAPVTDNEIKEKFRFFATSTGNPDTVLKANSSSWLEKFKQKNGIGAGRLVRRASETNIPDRHADSAVARAMESPSLTPIHHSNTRSPSSPTGQPSASPLSASRSDDEREAVSAGGTAAGSYMSFAHEATSPNGGHAGGHAGHNGMGLGGSLGMELGMGVGSYKHGNNQSSASLSSVFTETPVSVSSYSGSAMSPNMSFTFSPDSNVGSFLPPDSMGPPGSASFQRPRSQTLPALNLEYINQPQSDAHSQHSHHDASEVSMPDSMTPKYHLHVSSTAPSSAVDSPMTEMSASYGIDNSVVSPQLRRSSSSNSLLMSIPRSAGVLGGSSVGAHISGGSSPSSPTQEDARRAAETLVSFIQSVPNNFDQNEYMAIVRLAEKLRSHHHHQQQVAKATVAAQGMGGLTRIPEGDVEMASDASHPKLGSTMAV